MATSRTYYRDKNGRFASKEELLANGNGGSKKRNTADPRNPKWLELQLKNPDIPDEAKELLLKVPQLKPYPLGDGRARKAAWFETLRNQANLEEIRLENIARQKALDEAKASKKTSRKKR